MMKQYRSPVTASVHETAEGLAAAGVMSKRRRCASSMSSA